MNKPFPHYPYIAIPIVLLSLLCVHTSVLANTQQRPLKPRQVSSFRQLTTLLNRKSVHANGVAGLKMQAMARGTGVFVETGAIEHSDTNIQVAGVDEGDQVKTDGRYIYRIQNGQVVIVAARPAAAMAVVTQVTFDTGFYPIELYVQGDQLVVIGSGWYDSSSGSGSDAPVIQANGQAKRALWLPSGENRTQAKVYDISDRANPHLQREIAFSGHFLSSRRIGNNVYLLGRQYPHYFMQAFADPTTFRRQRPAMTRKNILPRIIDSTVNNGREHALPLRDLYFFPRFVEPDYVIVAGFRLDAPNQAANIKAYLGSGEIAYASKDNLYLSAADYNWPRSGNQSVSAPVTHIYKFALADGSLHFSNAGKIPGTVLNQYSMDEHGGYFRIATTTDQWTQTGDSGTLQTWNNLYILDSDMQVSGRLEHLAKGERIFSARFIGDRGYLVTFQQIDPLFVIDLAVPEAPKVLGELKIPGFSNYLHPFDATHLLGFGQDSEETTDGFVTTGMKLALFDVTDVTRPSQVHSLTLGAQGSYSPLQWDPKALLFNKKTGLLGFPISITKQSAGLDWPLQIFQGVHIYQVSVAEGFQKQAEITHMPDGITDDWQHYIDRLLTIGNQLYTLSSNRVQAHRLPGFTLTGQLDLPSNPQPVDCTTLTDDAVSSALIAGDCQILPHPFTETVVTHQEKKP